RTPPPPAISTLSLHDALPIYHRADGASFEVVHWRTTSVHEKRGALSARERGLEWKFNYPVLQNGLRHRHRHIRACFFMLQNTDTSEEHTSELQSPYDLVCRLL